jgi:predicted transcriptional regulator
MVKLTFSVDEATARALRQTAERLNKPQSLVVREAVAEYAAHAGRLTEAERRRMLKTIDDISKRPASRPQAAADREVREIRRTRRQAGRLHPVE